MAHPQVPLKNPWLAALLAFLLPGAGHFYQGRRFKAAIYFFCIIPTFLFGMHLGDWRVTYWLRDPSNILNPYYAQFWVGLPALPSLIQSRRVRGAGNPANATLETAVSVPFQGELRGYRDKNNELQNVLVDGQMTLDPADGALGNAKGTFTGSILKDNGPEPIELKLSVLEIEPKIGAEKQRGILCNVLSGDPADFHREPAKLSGAIPRTFWSWFQVPPTERQVQDLNRQLGKMLELAQIFTMIAGLLNILAIWDALEGPAYGYGDPHPNRNGKQPPEKKQTDPPTPGSSLERSTAEKPQAVGARSGTG